MIISPYSSTIKCFFKGSGGLSKTLMEVRSLKSPVLARWFGRGLTTLEIYPESRSATICIGNEESRNLNPISGEILSSFIANLDKLDRRGDEIEKLLIYSGKDHFSAGMDMRHILDTFEQKGPPEASLIFDQLFEAQHRILDSGLTTFTVFNGFGVGGGLAIGLCADYNLASVDSLFMFSGAPHGLGTFSSCVKTIEKNKRDDGYSLIPFLAMINATTIPFSGLELEGIFFNSIFEESAMMVRGTKNLNFDSSPDYKLFQKI